MSILSNTKYRTENGTTENIEEAVLSLCPSCHCMTYSIDKPCCFKCDKCEETKWASYQTQ